MQGNIAKESSTLKEIVRFFIVLAAALVFWSMSFGASTAHASSNTTTV